MFAISISAKLSWGLLGLSDSLPRSCSRSKKRFQIKAQVSITKLELNTSGRWNSWAGKAKTAKTESILMLAYEPNEQLFLPSFRNSINP